MIRPVLFQKHSRTGVAILALLVLVSASGLSAQTQALGKRMGIRPAGTEVILAYCEGTVMINGVRADIGALVPKDAKVVTGPDSVAEIVFNQKNVIRIAEKTSVRLDLETLRRTVKIENGIVSAVLHKLDKASGGSLDLLTPTASAGVRGTNFYTRVDASAGYTYVCICNGVIALSNPDGSEKVVKTDSHHDGTWFAQTNTGIEISAPPAGYDPGHSDASMESVAARIGEKIDWTKVEE